MVAYQTVKANLAQLRIRIGGHRRWLSDPLTPIQSGQSGNIFWPVVNLRPDVLSNGMSESLLRAQGLGKRLVGLALTDPAPHDRLYTLQDWAVYRLVTSFITFCSLPTAHRAGVSHA